MRQQHRTAKRQNGPEHETAGPRCERRGKIGAEHIERTVCQIHQVHNTEDQRQSGREQKQQQSKLQPVEALLYEKRHGSKVCGIASSKRRQRSCAAAVLHQHGITSYDIH